MRHYAKYDEIPLKRRRISVRTLRGQARRKGVSERTLYREQQLEAALELVEMRLGRKYVTQRVRNLIPRTHWLRLVRKPIGEIRSQLDRIMRGESYRDVLGTQEKYPRRTIMRLWTKLDRWEQDAIFEWLKQHRKKF